MRLWTSVSGVAPELRIFGQSRSGRRSRFLAVAVDRPADAARRSPLPERTLAKGFTERPSWHVLCSFPHRPDGRSRFGPHRAGNRLDAERIGNRGPTLPGNDMKHRRRGLYTLLGRAARRASSPERGGDRSGGDPQPSRRHLHLRRGRAPQRAASGWPGTRVCALFGREVKGQGFAALWGLNGAGAGVFEARSLVTSVLDEARGLVAGLQGLTRSGQDVEIELLLLPLRHGGRTHARLLGSRFPPSRPPRGSVSTRSCR